MEDKDHASYTVRLPILASRQRDRVHDRAPVTGCGGKHEGVPDRILEPQTSPSGSSQGHLRQAFAYAALAFHSEGHDHRERFEL